MDAGNTNRGGGRGAWMEAKVREWKCGRKTVKIIKKKLKKCKNLKKLKNHYEWSMQNVLTHGISYPQL